MYIYLWVDELIIVNKVCEVFSVVSINQNEKVFFYVKSDFFLWSFMDF